MPDFDILGIERAEKLMSMFRKYSRPTVVLAGLGFAVTASIAVYLVLTDAYPKPPHQLSTPLLVAFIAFCPASLLSIPFIDAEIGTSGFYFVWFLVGLCNAWLYGAVGAAVYRLKARTL